MNKKRPMFLNLAQMKFPVTAIISIGHRISGVVMFVSLPWLIYLFQKSTTSASSFAAIGASIRSFPFSLFLIATVFAFAYHISSGIRHIIMDMGFGKSWGVAKTTSYIVLVSTVVIGLLGVYLAW